MDKPEKVKSINGVSIVWFEECSEIKYDGYKEILGRIRTPNVSMHFILSCNPVSFDNWVYRRFFVSLDENGKEQPLLTAGEMENLSIRKGTLNAREREIIQSHVVVTARILDQIQFPDEYGHVPIWASEHHELLSGRGYPDHLQGRQIPKEVRLLTILDIFEALTAKDRPYKKPMTVERALSILESMVSNGDLDGDILALFKGSRAWEKLGADL